MTKITSKPDDWIRMEYRKGKWIEKTEEDTEAFNCEDKEQEME